jgi:quinol monooxygenase YgiN
MAATVTNAAFFTAQDGYSVALGARLLALAAPTRNEAGCLRYDIYHSSEDPNAWFVYEDWRSREDFDAHLRAPHVQAFMTELPALCGKNARFSAYRRVSRAA